MDFICNDNNQVASLQTKVKFYWLLNNENINIITKLSEFILKNSEKRSSFNQNTWQPIDIKFICVQAYVYIYIYYILNILVLLYILAPHLIDTYAQSSSQGQLVHIIWYTIA
jgi:hypothetical protein